MKEALIDSPLEIPDIDERRLAAERLARLRAALAEAPFDAVVLTSAESVFYATGYRAVATPLFRAHRMAAVVTGDDLWLVCPAADTAPAADLGVPEDRLIPYGRFYFESAAGSPLALAADRHPGLAAALATAVGAVGPRLKYAVEGPEEGLLDVPAVDATAWIAEVRGVKLPGEVELLRYAARLAESAVAAALAAAGPGVTERDLAAVVAATMVAGGAEPRFLVATTGPRTALADAQPTGRRWRPGELARFDVGCVYQGYWSDIGRTAVLGEPGERQARRYAAILAGLDEQLALARPGVPAEEVFEVAMRAVRRGGVDPYRRQHCGHGIGTAVYEPPIIAPGAATPLVTGMTFCFETPYYELGWGGMMVEDALVVTSGGVERFTRSPRALPVVAA
ncbi:aminopeptidase P family protein [Spongiactinospora gelatinilytica]|uniref:Aminopeptidase P family protein n=1 Tax=Spongiactinospora gelatinilytica TaxID=2666298 RepID=A0A2W2HSG9_9ACTN|nr:Xaa-Pro peptidase family protein [Spongiactinospora gelatinilytica]PZG48887.1 aminopeptidase P family protein [Spongiactinospora gelatinilytica]